MIPQCDKLFPISILSFRHRVRYEPIIMWNFIGPKAEKKKSICKWVIIDQIMALKIIMCVLFQVRESRRQFLQQITWRKARGNLCAVC